MTKEFLQRYNYTEERFLAWIKSQGMNPQDAINLIITYSKTNIDFRSGNELCSRLLKDLNQLEMDRAFYLAAAQNIEQLEMDRAFYLAAAQNIEQNKLLAIEQTEPGPEPEPKKSKIRRIWDLIVEP